MHVASIKVPIRGKTSIEREADLLLEEYRDETGSRIDGAIPVEEIARYHLCLRLEFADLHDVLACRDMAEHLIHSVPSSSRRAPF